MDEWMDSGWVHKQRRTNYMVSVTLFVSSLRRGSSEGRGNTEGSGITHFVRCSKGALLTFLTLFVYSLYLHRIFK